MNWFTIIQTIFNYLWLIAVLILLFLMWRSSEKRIRLEATLIDVAKSDAESARVAVENARTLAAILQNEQAKEKAK